MKSFLPLNPAKNDNQGIGAAITYLRRYSLSAIVGVVCDDDDVGETAGGRGRSQNGYHSKQISEKNGELNFFHDDPIKVLKKIIEKHKISRIGINQDYTQFSIHRDNEIKKFNRRNELKRIVMINADVLFIPQNNNMLPTKS